MILRGDFFTFTKLQTDGDVISTDINLNAAHPIFEGHFPGQPVLPGACMMQMVKEVTEVYVKKDIRLVKADDLKFLSFITPGKMIRMELKIDTEIENILVDARLLDDAAVLFKFKGKFYAR
jgi:3-hydroxyacyl-[acyl-carrier-protein] dehydratase